MADLTLQWDSKDIKAFTDRRMEKALVRVLTRAGNEAIRAMKVAASRSVRQRKRFKVARVNTAMPVFYPRKKSDIDDLKWTMRVEGKPVPVADFAPRETKKGVTVGINTGRRVLIKGAFLARMKSGHLGVFQRAFKGAPRLPIREAFTTRITDVFKDSGMVPAVQARTQAVFARAFARLMKMEKI